ncbi:MAG TPA: hypothetical protein VFV66_08540 [Nonomuraea sp.]|nr:hypothetical protein [Nonomuraea sp.]
MSHRFGELWTVQLGDRDEVRLIVSGDFYHTLYGDNVLIAHVEAADMAHTLTAFVVDGGDGRAAMVDRRRADCPQARRPVEDPASSCRTTCPRPPSFVRLRRSAVAFR